MDCDYHPGGTLVATASTDQTVKVWSVDGGYCTHNFVGHMSVVNLVRFFPATRSRLLFSAADNCEIRVSFITFHTLNRLTLRDMGFR